MLLVDRYEYNPQTDVAGRGEYSRVYRAIDTVTHDAVAIKMYRINDASGHYRAIGNSEIVRTLIHPALCTYFDIREIEKEDSFGEKETLQVCVTALLNSENMVDWYKKNKDAVLFKNMVLDLLNGLSYLHKKRIIHGYIKPSNILTASMNGNTQAVITDFAMGIQQGRSMGNGLQPLFSALPYLSPEQLDPQQYGNGGAVSYNTDLWSLAVVVYEALTGKQLFPTGYENTAAIQNRFKLPEGVDTLPEPFAELLKRCLVKDASARAQTAEELLPLFTGDEVGGQYILPLADASSLLPQQPETIPDANDNDTADDTKVLSLPKERADATDDTQLISPSATNAQPAEQLANIAAPDHKTVVDKEEDTTRVIKKPADAPAASQALFIENIITDEDTRIIAPPGKYPPADTSIANEEEAATKVLSKPGKVEEAKKVDPEEAPAVDETIIIAKANRDKQGSQPPASDTPGSAGAMQASAGTEPAIVIKRREKPVVLFNRYEYLPASDLIGKGGFSRVYKAFDKKLSRWVALKIYKTGEFSDRYSPIAEIKRVVNLDHPNICRYLDIEEIENENPFGENEKIQVCVMELLDSGNFAAYYRANENLDTLKKLVQDILNGLSYLHKNGIVHRDIKPGNILIKQTIEGPVAKITDFGISKNSDAENNSSSALIVSIPYMAPEQLNAKKYGVNEKVGYNLDLWSLGVTIYEVVTGKVLFKNSDQDNSEQIMANIMAPELPEKLNDLPEPFRTVVAHCVIKNARERASRAEELMVLLHTTAPVAPAAALASQAANLSLPSEHATVQPIPEERQSETVIVPSQNDKPLRSRFAIAEEEEEGKPLVETIEKKKNPLVIFLSAAVLVFILFFIYLKACNQLPTVSTAAGTHGADTARKANVHPVVVDTANKTVQPVEKKADTDNKHSDSLAKPPHAAEKKATKVEEGRKRTASPPESANANTASKYVLILSAEQNCILKINSIDYGELQPGKPLKVYLTTGKYMLQVISSSNSASVYSANIEVKASLLGHADKFKIPLK